MKNDTPAAMAATVRGYFIIIASHEQKVDWIDDIRQYDDTLRLWNIFGLVTISRRELFHSVTRDAGVASRCSAGGDDAPEAW
ncbi:MAG: hypothetical protein H0V22_08405 [Solirubrobacterales bacterium]|nr:hypothetical protein [Solirubrobacterales bacterium]